MSYDKIKSFSENNEKILKGYYAAYLPIVIRLHGYDAVVKRKSKDTMDDVYGEYSGTYSEKVDECKILLNGNQWTSISNFDGGYYEDLGYMYTDYDIMEADIFQIKRDDILSVELKAVNVESIGRGTQILKRFKISNTASGNPEQEGIGIY